MALMQAGRNAEAQAMLDPIVAKHPKDPIAVRAKGLLELRSGRFASAETWLARARRLDPANHANFLDQASLHKFHGRYADMVASCREALKRAPGNPGAEAMLARALESSGDLDGAYEFIQDVGRRRSLDPDTGECLMVVLDNSGRHDEALDASKAFLDAKGIPAVLRRRVLLRRGRILEKRGELDEALACYEAGHAEIPATFDPDRHDERLQQVAEALPAFEPAGEGDGLRSTRVPVFIVGLPRSGTSLVERILGAHPAASGIGESSVIQEVLRDHRGEVGDDFALGPLGLSDELVEKMRHECLERMRDLAGPADRVVSKHLQNWAFLGTIAFWFPASSLVRLERDPAANAISILGQDLPPDRMPWATRLDWIGRVMRAERRFVETVRPKLPNPWLSIRYEDLVSSPAEWIPRLVEAMGVPWDDACLEPHRAESRAVEQGEGGASEVAKNTSAGDRGARFQPTLSLHQVRQPISTDAARRAEAWGDRLAAFHEAFDGNA